MYIIYNGTKDESELNYQTVSMLDIFEMTRRDILLKDNNIRIILPKHC